MSENTKVVLTTGRNNCGGRCIIRCHVKDNEIIKITTETQKEAGDRVPLTACARGMNYHKTYINDRRLKYPMKRVGKRGEGKFERISWDEAIEIITREWIRIRDTYGPGSRHVLYGCGESAVLSGRQFTKRLLALDGGFLDYHNSYSSACVRYTTPYLYGPGPTGNSPKDWLNSSLIVLWGHNPAETVFDAITMYYLRKAKEAGIPMIGIDPRKNDTIKKLDADWYAIRPATDAALADAIAYELYSTGRYDKDFVSDHCIGFEKSTMPKGINETECYFSYLTGEQDGIIKDADWGEKITGLSADKIKELATRIWEAKPCNILQGLGPQRNEYGEQATRAAIMLACLTGNVGISGGNACGNADYGVHTKPSLPLPANPYGTSIPTFLWTDAITRGTEMTKLDGIKGKAHLDSDIKMILNIAGNTLINQHSDINRTREILEDESKCEFILVSDVFMTASAKYADILLPCTSFLEEENMTAPWDHSEFVGYNNPVLPPMYECRPEYSWLKEIARNLGLYDAFTEGHETPVDWLKAIYSDLQKIEKELPPFEELKEKGIFHYSEAAPVIAFQKQRKDLAHNPYPTPSGKIEIFSETIYYQEFTDPFPAIPRYMESENGYEHTKNSTYPLQLMGWHTKRRCHTIHDNNPEMERLDPRRIVMNPVDAKLRGLTDSEEVLIENERGQMILPVSITEDIMPGVTAIAQGAWYNPDENGVDRGGCINIFTTQKPTPLAKGNPQHTNCVEVRKR